MVQSHPILEWLSALVPVRTSLKAAALAYRNGLRAPRVLPAFMRSLLSIETMEANVGDEAQRPTDQREVAVVDDVEVPAEWRRPRGYMEALSMSTPELKYAVTTEA